MKIDKYDRFTEAYRLAANAHLGQTVKGGKLPYIVHVSEVCFEIFSVLDELSDPALALQAAALHDVVEDTSFPIQTIEQEFGHDVAEAVLALTKNDQLEEDEQIPDSLARIKKLSKDIWVVKLADRIANLKPPPESWTNEKIKKYHDVSMLIYEELKGANKTLADRLMRRIEAYKNHIES
ncbi:MAG TPA: HD domain-containing protein [Chitinophagaceae bacterium]|jgi:guanosine-3',5'-bis(diphosphate) 3'-pyrophosphohydrolase|nr:HD domain-containing protein [Chitinophagaceae bacterium]